MTCPDDKTRGAHESALPDGSRSRPRVVVRDWMQALVGVLWATPWLLGGIGGGLLALVGEPLDDWWPGSWYAGVTTICLTMHALFAVQVVTDYWLPRWVDLVLSDGTTVRPAGGLQLFFISIFSQCCILVGVVIYLDAGTLPPAGSWPVVCGSLVMILPAAVHRAIERRRFPELRLGDGT